MKNSNSMNRAAKYDSQYTDIGFDRTDLFEFIKDLFHSNNVLYPGSSIHISPSFIFENVAYVDRSSEASDFFADGQAVRKIIDKGRRGNGSRNYEFMAIDYIEEGLPFEDNSFDLLISLYADNIIEYCRRYVRDEGIIISNNFYDEVLKELGYDELYFVFQLNGKNKERTAGACFTEYGLIRHQLCDNMKKICNDWS